MAIATLGAQWPKALQAVWFPAMALSTRDILVTTQEGETRPYFVVEHLDPPGFGGMTRQAECISGFGAGGVALSAQTMIKLFTVWIPMTTATGFRRVVKP